MTTQTVAFTGEVHPIADLFPMLDEEELPQLAADIRLNGLINPIVLDGEGRLVDGRNRLAACKLAGVEPHFTVLRDREPVAYIISMNVSRRHMSKGQCAMHIIEAEAEKLPDRNAGPSRTNASVGSRSLAEELGVSHTRLQMAATVHQYGHPKLCAAVRVGGKLDQAYEQARQIKKRLDDAEKWEAGAEERARKAAEERERRLAEIRLAREEIGPAVAVPPLPSIEEILAGLEDAEVEDEAEGTAGAESAAPRAAEMQPIAQFDTLEAEKALYMRLDRLKREIEEVCSREPFISSWSPADHVRALHGWATQIAAQLSTMVAAHKALLDQGPMRIVK